MKIESIIRRKNGTTVQMGGKTYHFWASPETGLAHVAEVEEPAHIQRFLSITEGFRPYAPEGAETAPVPSPQPAHTAPGPVPGADEMSAHEAASPVNPDALGVEGTVPGAVSTEAPSAAVAPAAEATAPQKLDVDALDGDELRALYASLNGRPAPANAKDATLRAKVKELQEAAAAS